MRAHTPAVRSRESLAHKLVGLALCGLSLGAAPAPRMAHAQASPPREPTTIDAWYLVFEVDAEGVVDLRSSARVRLDGPLPSSAPPPSAQPEDDIFRVQLSDTAGSLLDERWVEIPRVVRGEFHGDRNADGTFEIDGVAFQPAKRAFVVRVPAVERGIVVLEGARTSSFALADIAERATRVASATGVASLGRSGPSSNRVDLAIFGDGYRAEESGLFEDDARTLANQFFSISPYAEYRNFVNVTSVFVPSAESGADHPPYAAGCGTNDPSCCADTASQGDPLSGTFVDTAFDGTYCGFNIQRLAIVDTGKVLAAAAAVPQWDRILVLLNDETYGGSGGLLSVTSTNQAAVDIARHEYGHSFTGLADEYDAETPGYAPCSDSDTAIPGCEANVTDQTNRSLIKWEPWIGAATPVPTPENGAFGEAVGLFEGARYRPEGMYRPRDRCLMNVLGVDFGEVCREEYVLELYRGGWGTPRQGIELIEPRSASPAGSTVKYEGVPIDFRAALLQPVGAPPLDVIWTVDGVAVANDTDTFRFTPPGPGTFEVELTVRDTTPFVLPRNAAVLESRRRWTVRAELAPSECVAGETTLCLEEGRFQVTVDWSSAAGAGGQGQVVPVGSDNSGLFSFFDPNNWEMLIKVLDACGTNGRYWVFLAATTDLEYTVTVVDTDTGATRAYENSAGNRAPAVTDTDAFSGCAGPGAVSVPHASRVRLDRLDEHPSVVAAVPPNAVRLGDAAAPCTDDDQSLCLNRSRFEVSITWRDFQDNTGSATVVPFRSDDSGLFYIFDPDNWELLVKVLDACALNDRYWVFAAATTDIEYTLRVRDTATNAVREYSNPLGTASPAITDTAAFEFCPQ